MPAIPTEKWVCGVGAGDEIVCPAMTYWASCAAVLGLGATVNFADIDPATLCIDPADIEHRIGPRTRAIVAVHYAGHPCDMDAILGVARRHGIRVIEDVSHAHGSLYKDSGSTMGPWYYPRGLYRGEELGGLSCADFCEAVRAEGIGDCQPGANFPLHTHPVFHEADLFHQGRPTALAFGQRDVRQGAGTLPHAERIAETVFGVPWFKHDRAGEIERYAAAYRKVARQSAALLAAPPRQRPASAASTSAKLPQ